MVLQCRKMGSYPLARFVGSIPTMRRANPGRKVTAAGAISHPDRIGFALLFVPSNIHIIDVMPFVFFNGRQSQIHQKGGRAGGLIMGYIAWKQVATFGAFCT